MSSDPFLTNNLKSLLQDKLWLLESRLNKKRANTDYKMLSEAEVKVLATLRGEELTISEIARKLNVSRQAVHKIISNLAERKLVKLEYIEGNSRDKRIVFTHSGNLMKKAAAKTLQDLEQEVKSALGSHDFHILKSLLEKDW